MSMRSSTSSGTSSRSTILSVSKTALDGAPLGSISGELLSGDRPLGPPSHTNRLQIFLPRPSLGGPQVGEQHLLQGLRSPRSSGRVLVQLERLEPPGFAQGIQPEEPKLRVALLVRGFVQSRPADRPQLPAARRRQLHIVARKRLATVLQREAAGLQPYGGLLASQPLLTVEPPVAETRDRKSTRLNS